MLGYYNKIVCLATITSLLGYYIIDWMVYHSGGWEAGLDSGENPLPFLQMTAFLLYLHMRGERKHAAWSVLIKALMTS